MSTPEDNLPPIKPVRPMNAADKESTLPPGADAEERFNEFWRTNGTAIFTSIAIGAVIVIGAQTWRYVKSRIEKNTQAAYASASNKDQLLTFAQDHDSHALAGAAYFRIANDEFISGQYKQASEHFNMAKERLAGTPFAERAELGRAMSLLMNNQKTEAEMALRAILDNPSNLEETRAEAGFNLAISYLEKKDYASVNAIIEMADTFGEKNSYALHIRDLRYQIPEKK
jgi:predicted negative regulator of RcsB-dependent stress response